MTTKELTHLVRSKHLIDQTAVTSATQTTAAFDTLGYESAAIVWDISVWAGAASTWTPKLQESDTTTSGDFTDCAITNVEWFKDGVPVTGLTDANGPVVSTTDTDQCTIAVSYVGGTKRYIRGVLTLSGTPTTMVAVPIGLVGHPRETYGTVYTDWPDITW